MKSKTTKPKMRTVCYVKVCSYAVDTYVYHTASMKKAKALYESGKDADEHYSGGCLHGEVVNEDWDTKREEATV